MDFSVHEINGIQYVTAADLIAQGIHTYDPELRNTVSNLSAISVLDGQKGKLYYRGVDIENLAGKRDFLESACLILTGHLPNKNELLELKRVVADYSIIDKKVQRGILSIIKAFPKDSDPTSILSAITSYLSSADPLPVEKRSDQITACLKTIAFSPIITGLLLAHISGNELHFPTRDDFGQNGEKYDYATTFLKALNGKMPITETQKHILDTIFTLHLDAGLSPSTFAAQQSTSSQTGMWSGMVSASNSLAGPLHGGANRNVLKMFEQIHNMPEAELGKKVEEYIDLQLALDKRIPGIGHIVFKTIDPRAIILQKMVETSYDKNDYYQIAKAINDHIGSSVYFKERNLCPNIDFYSGLVWKQMGVPDNGMPVAFFTARAVGYAAHILEAKEKGDIVFPEQVYIGQLGLSIADVQYPESSKPSTEILPIHTKLIALPSLVKHVEL